MGCTQSRTDKPPPPSRGDTDDANPLPPSLPGGKTAPLPNDEVIDTPRIPLITMSRSTLEENVDEGGDDDTDLQHDEIGGGFHPALPAELGSSLPLLSSEISLLSESSQVTEFHPQHLKISSLTESSRLASASDETLPTSRDILVSHRPSKKKDNESDEKTLHQQEIREEESDGKVWCVKQNEDKQLSIGHLSQAYLASEISPKEKSPRSHSPKGAPPLSTTSVCSNAAEKRCRASSPTNKENKGAEWGGQESCLHASSLKANTVGQPLAEEKMEMDPSISDLRAVWCVLKAKSMLNKRHAVAVQEWLNKLELLLSLLDPFDSNNELRKTLLEADVLCVCLDALDLPHPGWELIVTCLAVMVHIVMNDQATPIFARHQGMSRVLECFNQYYSLIMNETKHGTDPSLCSKALEILILVWRIVFATSVDGPEFAQMWIESGALHAISDSLTRPREAFTDPQYIGWCLAALRLLKSDTHTNCPTSPKTNKTHAHQPVDSGVLLDRVIDNIKKHPTDPLVMENGLAVIVRYQQQTGTEICSQLIHSKRDFFCGLIESLSSPPLSQKDDVIFQGLLALGLSCIKCPEMRECLRRHGGIEFSRRMVDLHYMSCDIPQLALTLQTVLAMDKDKGGIEGVYQDSENEDNLRFATDQRAFQEELSEKEQVENKLTRFPIKKTSSYSGEQETTDDSSSDNDQGTSATCSIQNKIQTKESEEGNREDSDEENEKAPDTKPSKPLKCHTTTPALLLMGFPVPEFPRAFPVPDSPTGPERISRKECEKPTPQESCVLWAASMPLPRGESDDDEISVDDLLDADESYFNEMTDERVSNRSKTTFCGNVNDGGEESNLSPRMKKIKMVFPSAAIECPPGPLPTDSPLDIMNCETKELFETIETPGEVMPLSASDYCSSTFKSEEENNLEGMKNADIMTHESTAIRAWSRPLGDVDDTPIHDDPVAPTSRWEKEKLEDGDVNSRTQKGDITSQRKQPAEELESEKEGQEHNSSDTEIRKEGKSETTELQNHWNQSELPLESRLVPSQKFEKKTEAVINDSKSSQSFLFLETPITATSNEETIIHGASKTSEQLEMSLHPSSLIFSSACSSAAPFSAEWPIQNTDSAHESLEAAQPICGESDTNGVRDEAQKNASGEGKTIRLEKFDGQEVECKSVITVPAEKAETEAVEEKGSISPSATENEKASAIHAVNGAVVQPALVTTYVKQIDRQTPGDEEVEGMINEPKCQPEQEKNNEDEARDKTSAEGKQRPEQNKEGENECALQTNTAKTHLEEISEQQEEEGEKASEETMQKKDNEHNKEQQQTEDDCQFQHSEPENSNIPDTSNTPLEEQKSEHLNNTRAKPFQTPWGALSTQQEKRGEIQVSLECLQQSARWVRSSSPSPPQEFVTGMTFTESIALPNPHINSCSIECLVGNSTSSLYASDKIEATFMGGKEGEGLVEKSKSVQSPGTSTYFREYRIFGHESLFSSEKSDSPENAETQKEKDGNNDNEEEIANQADDEFEALQNDESRSASDEDILRRNGKVADLLQNSASPPAGVLPSSISSSLSSDQPSSAFTLASPPSMVSSSSFYTSPCSHHSTVKIISSPPSIHQSGSSLKRFPWPCERIKAAHKTVCSRTTESVTRATRREHLESKTKENVLEGTQNIILNETADLAPQSQSSTHDENLHEEDATETNLPFTTIKTTEVATTAATATTTLTLLEKEGPPSAVFPEKEKGEDRESEERLNNSRTHNYNATSKKRGKKKKKNESMNVR